MPIGGHVDDVSREQVRGWAMPPQSNGPAKIQIVVNGQVHGTCVADIVREGLGEVIGQPGNDAHAFVYEFHPPLSMFREYRLEIRVAETGELIPSGARTIHAIRAQRATLAPVLITSRGRAGTTLLMRHLSGHPEVVVADAYPYEVELMAYYVTALNVMAAPRFDGTQDKPDMVEEALETCAIGGNPWNIPALHRHVGGDELERMFAESVPLHLSSLFRTVVLDYYSIAARKSDKRQVRFIAEKCGLSEHIRHGIRGVMGEIKEIVLVRDPRDFLCSARSYWKLPDERILPMMDDVYRAYAALAGQDEHDVLMIRYEDLVAEQSCTLGRISDFIGLTEPFAEGEATDLFLRHGTSSTPLASIGRWRKELAPDVCQHCEHRFASFMELLGYG
jgi:hypothetical protein